MEEKSTTTYNYNYNMSQQKDSILLVTMAIMQCVMVLCNYIFKLDMRIEHLYIPMYIIFIIIAVGLASQRSQ